jgi:hypothetical protein
MPTSGCVNIFKTSVDGVWIKHLPPHAEEDRMRRNDGTYWKERFDSDIYAGCMFGGDYLGFRSVGQVMVPG